MRQLLKVAILLSQQSQNKLRIDSIKPTFPDSDIPMFNIRGSYNDNPFEYEVMVDLTDGSAAEINRISGTNLSGDAVVDFLEGIYETPEYKELVK